MPEFSIESNGMLEKTAVYYNGAQLSGIKEIFVHIDETGGFDAFVQYVGKDKNVYTKKIFTDYLVEAETTEPSFTEEDAMELQLLTIESEGDLDSTVVSWNEEPLDGIVDMLIHIKGTEDENGIKKFFSSKKLSGGAKFIAEIIFREEDDSLETEQIF